MVFVRGSRVPSSLCNKSRRGTIRDSIVPGRNERHVSLLFYIKDSSISRVIKISLNLMQKFFDKCS